MPQMVNLVNHFLIFSDTYLNTFSSLNQKIINQTNIVHVEVEKMNMTFFLVPGFDYYMSNYSIMDRAALGWNAKLVKRDHFLGRVRPIF